MVQQCLNSEVKAQKRVNQIKCPEKDRFLRLRLMTSGATGKKGNEEYVGKLFHIYRQYSSSEASQHVFDVLSGNIISEPSMSSYGFLIILHTETYVVTPYKDCLIEVILRVTTTFYGDIGEKPSALNKEG